MRTEVLAGGVVSDSFLQWHRVTEYDASSRQVKYRGVRHQSMSGGTQVVACRYWYEMTDGFWGQYAVTQFPHLRPEDVLPGSVGHLEFMQNYVGLFTFLCALRRDGPGVLVGRGGVRFCEFAMPLLVAPDVELKCFGQGRHGGGHRRGQPCRARWDRTRR